MFEYLDSYYIQTTSVEDYIKCIYILKNNGYSVFYMDDPEDPNNNIEDFYDTFNRIHICEKERTVTGSKGGSENDIISSAEFFEMFEKNKVQLNISDLFENKVKKLKNNEKE